MQYGECPATEIQWNGQVKYESVARDISIQHSGNIAVSISSANGLTEVILSSLDLLMSIIIPTAWKIDSQARRRRPNHGQSEHLA